MSQQKLVGLVDYGMGNLRSLESAFTKIGAKVEITNEPSELASFTHLVLPGVGSFKRASEQLFVSGLGQEIARLIREDQKQILGICLGMQLLGLSSPEDGLSLGLGLVPLKVERFTSAEVGGRPIPHIGFAATTFPQGSSGIFSGFKESVDFYYVHSYRMEVPKNLGFTATCEYGSTFLAGFDLGRVCGTQFHPEKSQSQGLHLLRNFTERSL